MDGAIPLLFILIGFVGVITGAVCIALIFRLFGYAGPVGHGAVRTAMVNAIISTAFCMLVLFFRKTMIGHTLLIYLIPGLATVSCLVLVKCIAQQRYNIKVKQTIEK